RIVDQDRDGADLLLDLRGNLAASVTLGYVEREACCLATGCCDRLGGLARRIAIDVEDGDLRSLARITQRDCPPDAGPATGDGCNASIEKPCHFVCPPSPERVRQIQL